MPQSQASLLDQLKRLSSLAKDNDEHDAGPFLAAISAERDERAEGPTPKPPTDEVLLRLARLANRNGLYDAADLMVKYSGS